MKRRPQPHVLVVGKGDELEPPRVGVIHIAPGLEGHMRQDAKIPGAATQDRVEEVTVSRDGAVAADDACLRLVPFLSHIVGGPHLDGLDMVGEKAEGAAQLPIAAGVCMPAHMHVRALAVGHEQAQLPQFLIEHDQREAHAHTHEGAVVGIDVGRGLEGEIGIAHVEQDVVAEGGGRAAVLVASRAYGDGTGWHCFQGILDGLAHLRVGVFRVRVDDGKRLHVPILQQTRQTGTEM